MSVCDIRPCNIIWFQCHSYIGYTIIIFWLPKCGEHVANYLYSLHTTLTCILYIAEFHYHVKMHKNESRKMTGRSARKNHNKTFGVAIMIYIFTFKSVKNNSRLPV